MLLFFFLSAWTGGFAFSLYLVSKDAVKTDRIVDVCAGDAGQLPATPEDLEAEPVECSPIPPDFCRAPEVLNGVPSRREIYAFLPHDPVWSLEAVKDPCFALDVLLVESHRIVDVGSGPFAVSAEQETAPVAQLMASRAWRHVKLRPVVRLSSTAWSVWGTELPPNPRGLADEITAVLPAAADGFCLWFDGGIPANETGNAAVMLERLHGWAADRGMEFCVIMPVLPESPSALKLDELADKIVLQAFLPPQIGGTPSPPVELERFGKAIASAVADYGADKLVVALGAFTQDWTVGQPRQERIPFADAMQRIAREGGSVGFDTDNLVATATYLDEGGRQHDLTILDAISARNLIQISGVAGVQRFAVWPLGYEDPGIWRALRMPADVEVRDAAALLSEVNLQDQVSYEGTGAFIRLISPAQDGLRRVFAAPGIDGTALLHQNGFRLLPRPYALQRYGSSFAPVVALTFDDGPDPQFTPQVLDVLAEKNVPAAFFQVGSNVVAFPDITRRIVDEGHEIGSHTFFHPRLEEVSPLWATAELNAFQRLLASVTGRRTILFRTPYGRSDGPISGDEAEPLMVLDRLGYIVVGSDITPRDWEGLPADEIVAFIRERLADGAGNVLVLHDAGGDRRTTIAALPLLIDQLRADGYEFVSLAELLRTDRDTLMPSDAGLRASFDGATFVVLGTVGETLRWVFWVAVIMGGIRATSVLAMALIRGRRHTEADEDYAPSVTVLVPAFNEESTVVDSVSAVLASTYQNLAVIVVDDGSDDRTLDRLRESFGADPRVTIVTEPNQGKWMALDNAYQLVATDIVVAIDADAMVDRDCIARLVAPFRDPGVGAVAGNVKVRTLSGLLSRLQALEYLTSQNVDRRAAELYNGIIVVPGSVGAWRVQAVREAGFYSPQTLTEDADLTVSVLRCGYRVVFEERAISHTEVPRTAGAFLRQRLRWIFGMIQTSWKHRRAGLERRPVGLISIPDLFVFGLILPMLAPIADLVFLGTLADTAINALSGREAIVQPASLAVLFGYLTLPALDLVKILVALVFERNDKWALIAVWPFQRLIYQPMLYFTVYRSVYRALTGKLAGWGRLRKRAPAERSAS